jgi:hypothetical protein
MKRELLKCFIPAVYIKGFYKYGVKQESYITLSQSTEIVAYKLLYDIVISLRGCEMKHRKF